MEASSDGRELVAIGSEDGVWIGEPQNPECEYVQLLSLYGRV